MTQLRQERIFGLDVVRVFALLLVLVQHCALDYEFIGRTKLGIYALEIFFVLSGFLIGGILFRDIDKEWSSRKTLLTFLYRRWWRILPLYYLMLLAEWMLHPEVPAKAVAYYAVFLQNFRMYEGFFVHSWSLAVEEWFYLAAPLFVIVVCKRFHDRKKIIGAFLLFMLSIVLLRFAYILTRENLAGNYWVMKAIPPFRFDSLFCGVLLAYFHHTRHALFARLQKRSWFLGGTFFCIAYILLVQYGGQSPAARAVLSWVLPVIGFLALSAAMTLTIPYAMRWKAPQQQTRFGKLVYNLVTYGSVMSYAIYLIHPFFYEWMNTRNGFGKGMMAMLTGTLHSELAAFVLFFILRSAVILGAAYLIYRFLDKPVLKLRDRLTGVKGVQLPG